MGRKSRDEHYGAIYHIITNGKCLLFLDDEDKIKFLGILGEIKEILDFKLIAYCLLDNQYNLLIKSHNIPISRVMQRINMRYAKYFNLKYQRTGSPFKGRYSSVIVNDGNNLLNIIRYIHSLPVLLKLTNSMAEYKWSSDVFYRINMEGVVDIDYILDFLSEDRNTSIEKYEELINSLDGEYEPTHSALELDDILMSVCENKNDFELIKRGSKKFYLMRYKDEYIKASKDLGFSCYEIGKNISMSERSIRKHLTKDKGES